MSGSNQRGGRGRGRGGYRPKRCSTVECSDTDIIRDSTSLPAVFSVSTPVIAAAVAIAQAFQQQPQNSSFKIIDVQKPSHINESETRQLFERLKCASSSNDKDEIRCGFCASTDHLTRKCSMFDKKVSKSFDDSPGSMSQSRKLLNSSKQSHISEIETRQLFEQLKRTPMKTEEEEDNEEDELRCEFCANTDHLTRNCTIFNENSTSNSSNVCYICKESGHYKNQCPRKFRDRGRLDGSSNRRPFQPKPSSNRGGGGSSSGMRWSPVHMRFNQSSNGNGSDNAGDFSTLNASATQHSHSFRNRPHHYQPSHQRINVPMPVPASSIKPPVQLRSKMQPNELAAATRQTAAAKSMSKNSYVRSDTDDFSTSDDELDEELGDAASKASADAETNSSVKSASVLSSVDNNTNNENDAQIAVGKTKSRESIASRISKKAEKQQTPVKEKFDLSSISTLKSSYSSNDFIKREERSHPSKRRLKLSEILYPSNAQCEKKSENNLKPELKHEKDDDPKGHKQNEKDVSNNDSLNNSNLNYSVESSKGGIVDNIAENSNDNTAQKEVKDTGETEKVDDGSEEIVPHVNKVDDLTSANICIDFDSDASVNDGYENTIEADVEFYGYDGAILNEDDSELEREEKAKKNNESSTESDSSKVN